MSDGDVSEVRESFEKPHGGARQVSMQSANQPALWWSGPRWWKLVPIEVLKTGGLLLVIPFLVNWKTDFFEGDSAQAARVQSWVQSARSILSMAVVVQVGQISDVIGRRPLIALSVLCTMLPLLCLALFPDQLWYYFAAYVLVGILGGQQSPATKAYIADCAPQEDRAHIFGYYGAVISGVVAVAPAVAGFVAWYATEFYGFNGRQAVSATATCMATFAFVATWLLPESLPREERQPFSCKLDKLDCRSTILTLRQLFRRRGSILWDLAVIRFLRGSVLGVPSFFAYKQLVGLNEYDFSCLMTIAGISGVVVQAVLPKLLSQRLGWSNLTIILATIVVDILTYTVQSLLQVYPYKWVVFSLSVIRSLHGLYKPAFDAESLQTVNDDKGIVLGTFTAVDALTSVVSPPIFSLVYSMSFVAPFISAVVLNVLCLVLIILLKKRVRREAQEANQPLTGAEMTTSTAELRPDAKKALTGAKMTTSTAELRPGTAEPEPEAP